MLCAGRGSVQASSKRSYGLREARLKGNTKNREKVYKPRSEMMKFIGGATDEAAWYKSADSLAHGRKCRGTGLLNACGLLIENSIPFQLDFLSSYNMIQIAMLLYQSQLVWFTIAMGSVKKPYLHTRKTPD